MSCSTKLRLLVLCRLGIKFLMVLRCDCCVISDESLSRLRSRQSRKQAVRLNLVAGRRNGFILETDIIWPMPTEKRLVVFKQIMVLALVISVRICLRRAGRY